MTNEETKPNFSKYMLTLNVYSLEACAVLVVMGDLTEPLYTTYMDYAVSKKAAPAVIRDIILDLFALTDYGENKFVAMSVPVEPTFFCRTDITDNRDLLVRSLRESELFVGSSHPEHVPNENNFLSMVTDDSYELVSEFLEYVQYNIDLRQSEDESADMLDHRGNPLSGDTIYYDKIKMDDGRQYYLYFKRRKGVVNLPNCESFSIIYMDYDMHVIFTISVNIIIDIVSISILYNSGYNVKDHHYSTQAFTVYMLKCRDILQDAYKNNVFDVDSEQSIEYIKYINTHVENVKRAFYEYGLKLCEVVGADYNVVFDNIEKHDKSKYSEKEFIGYRDYFYPDPKKLCDEDDDAQKAVLIAFRSAWLHHIHNNPHHPEYWNMVTGHGDNKILDMPPEYIVEMICDWQSFAYKDDSAGDAYTYFNKDNVRKEKCALMTENTIKLVEAGLEVLKSDK